MSPCTDTYVHTHHIYNHAHMHVHKPMCACGSAHPQVHACIQAHTLVPPTCTPGCRHMLMHTHAHSEHMDMHTHVCASHRHTHSSPPRVHREVDTCTRTHTHTHSEHKALLGLIHIDFLIQGSQQICGAGAIFIPIFQMRKLRHQEIK